MKGHGIVELHDGHCKVDANPPATIEWIKNLNTDQEEVIGETNFEDADCKY